MDNLLEKQYSAAKSCKSSCEMLCHSKEKNGAVKSGVTPRPVSFKKSLVSNHNGSRQGNC